jgi:hypothetical protein
VLAGILLLQAGLLANLAWRTGITFDEPAHLIASYAFWIGEDILEPSSTPVLEHWMSGWIPAVLGIELHRDLQGWRDLSMYDVARETLWLAGPERAQGLIRLARLPFLVFPLGITLVAAVWGARLFGAAAGLWLGAAAALEPSLLAHGALIKFDVAAAFFLLLVAWRLWCFWLEPDRRNLWLAAASVAVTMLGKYTLFFALPLAMAVVAVRYGKLRRWKTALGATLLVPALSWLAMTAAYRFDVATTRSEEFLALYDHHHWTEEQIAFARSLYPIPLPVSLARGVRYIWHHNRYEGQAAYMLGEKITPPEPLYFPLALGVKYPIALQILLVLAIAALVARLATRRAGAADFLLWAPAAVVFASALEARLLVGFRYILPVVPLVLLAGGWPLGRMLRVRAGQAVAAALLVWLAASSLAVYPHGIAYFNEWAGGPDRGWRYLADSNLDWGQNLPELTRWMDRQGVKMINLGYFGVDVPEHHIPYRFDNLPSPFWGDKLKENRYLPGPGYYAISLNCLLGFYWEGDRVHYFEWFRDREPIAKAGYSIFIYRVE